MVGPYFPLSRFGDLFVTARDDDGKVVSFSRFEKVGEQRRAAADLERQGHKVEVGVLTDVDLVRNQIHPGFIADVEDIVRCTSFSRTSIIGLARLASAPVPVDALKLILAASGRLKSGSSGADGALIGRPRTLDREFYGFLLGQGDRMR